MAKDNNSLIIIYLLKIADDFQHELFFDGYSLALSGARKATNTDKTLWVAPVFLSPINCQVPPMNWPLSSLVFSTSRAEVAGSSVHGGSHTESVWVSVR